MNQLPLSVTTWLNKHPQNVQDYITRHIQTRDAIRQKTQAQLAAETERIITETLNFKQLQKAQSKLEETAAEYEEEALNWLAYTQPPILGQVDETTLTQHLDQYLDQVQGQGVDILSWLAPPTWIQLAAILDENDKASGRGPGANTFGIGYRHAGHYMTFLGSGTIEPDRVTLYNQSTKQETITHIPPTFLTRIPEGAQTYNQARKAGLDTLQAILATIDTLNPTINPRVRQTLGPNHSPIWLRHIQNAQTTASSRTTIAIGAETALKKKITSNYPDAALHSAAWHRTETLKGCLDAWDYWQELVTPPEQPTFNPARAIKELTQLANQPGRVGSIYANPATYLHLAPLLPASPDGLLRLQGTDGPLLIQLASWVPQDAITILAEDETTTEQLYLSPAGYTDIQHETYVKMRRDGISAKDAEQLTPFATKPVKKTRPSRTETADKAAKQARTQQGH